MVDAGRRHSQEPCRCATGRTVLVVEDDAGVALTFARILQLSGYRVVTAQDGEEALRAAAAHNPDAILLDLRLPRIDGVCFLRRLRSLECETHTPVAIITGDYCLEEALSSELRGLDAAIYFKPLWVEDLLRITDCLLPSER